MQTIGERVSLYFHIPFCTKKCPYCHFYVIPNRLSHQKLLRDSLILEWQQRAPLLQGKEISSVYFGGGTPSLFLYLQDLLPLLPKSKECEITIEANPEEGDFSLFSRFRELGINRLSLGVQSLDERSLQTLERTHSAQKARQAIEDASRAGFDNISIDLMYDLPGQTEESWNYTLSQLADLPIQHLSLYNLTIEPHTSFHKRKVKTPNSELSLRFLQTALNQFASIGLHRYEISAFSRPAKESKHNLGYWTGRPFLGFGPSAFSYWEGARFRNICNIHRWSQALQENRSQIDFEEKLCYPANVKELFAIQLRIKTGVPVSRFALPEETRASIQKLKKMDLLKEEELSFRLTEKGMLFYDTVATELI